jgi:hypothetical protein
MKCQDHVCAHNKMGSQFANFLLGPRLYEHNSRKRRLLFPEKNVSVKPERLPSKLVKQRKLVGVNGSEQPYLFSSITYHNGKPVKKG